VLFLTFTLLGDRTQAQGEGILYVAPGGDCGGGSPCYAHPQGAVDAADASDIIKVAVGTYTDVNSYGGLAQVVYIPKSVSLRGGYTIDNWDTPDPGANPTILDARGQGRVLYITGDISSTIEGLRIVSGNASGLGGGLLGGDAGGGVYIINAMATLKGCQILSSTAAYGGGLYLAHGVSALRGNTVRGNMASDVGGGLFLSYSEATLSNNMVVDNHAQIGSGLYVEGSSSHLLHTTLAHRTSDGGSAVYVGDHSAVAMTNTVVTSHAVGVTAVASGVAMLEGTLWYGNGQDVGGAGTVLTGTVNVHGDPAFVAPGTGDYHVASDSAALDVGVDAGIVEDIDGEARPLCGGYDIGADELMPSFPVADFISSSPDWLGQMTLFTNTTAVTGCVSYLWSFGDGNISTTVHPAYLYVDPGAYSVVLTATNDVGTSVATATVEIYDVAFITSSPDWLGQTTFFTNTSVLGGMATYLWEFGDGVTSTLESPTHTYLIPGLYSVTLTVNTDAGSKVVTDTVSVYGVPEAEFVGYPREGIRPLTVTFTSAVTTTPPGDPTLAYWWSFGDGGVSALVNPTHTYAVPGGYTVTLTVDNAAGSTTLTRTSYITVNPVPVQADFTAWPTSGAIPLTVVFSNTSSGDYVTSLWDFGDGITSTDENPSHTYTATGSFTVSLTVSGFGESDTETKPGYVTTHRTCYARLNDDPTDYITVQAAVDASTAPTDVVKVAGVCSTVSSRYGVTQVVHINKTLTIRGGYTVTNWTDPDPVAHPTILDAQGKGRVLYITGLYDTPTVEGVHITGGDARGQGGGPRDKSVGGGIYIVNAVATISNCQIYANTGGYGGGGLYLYFSDSELHKGVISGNIADYGGGVYLDNSAAVLGDSVISLNTAEHDGGGLYLTRSDAALEGSTISSNAAGHDGGGLYLTRSDAVLSGDSIASNTAGGDGGGLYVRRSDASLVNNFVVDNQVSGAGAGLYIQAASPQLFHTTIAHNGGQRDGVHVTSRLLLRSSVGLTNTILVGHGVGITVTAGNTATLNATLWGAGAWANTTDWGGGGSVIVGMRNYWGDPGFVDADGGDYHLAAGSAALDKGVYVGIASDIDGDPRPDGCGVDIGADEYQGQVCHWCYLPLILRGTGL